jgi:RNA polymerase subunit RPABC4/transcription elongation factor Spt4
MFCTNCGGKIEDGAKFCPGCGKAASNEQVAPTVQQGVNVIQQQPAVSHTQTPTADEKFCFSCGAVIKKAAEICPKCGVNQSSRNNITAVDVYCTSCGKSIKKDASVCPYCGVQQGGSFNLFTKDKKGFAIASLVLGLCGMIAWLLPLTGFPVTILGLIMGVLGYKSSKRGMAIAGLILSMVGLVATIINSAIGAYQGATGF